jgi:hypothetical protein
MVLKWAKAQFSRAVSPNDRWAWGHFFTRLLVRGCLDERLRLHLVSHACSVSRAHVGAVPSGRFNPLAPPPLPTRMHTRPSSPARRHPNSCIRGLIATCAITDLFLQHPDETLATYIWNSWNTYNIRLKHLQNTWKHLKDIANICNIQIYFYNI